MGSILSEIFTLVTSPPGSLTYHLVIVFSIAWAFQASLQSYRHSLDPTARRSVFGLALLLLARIALFFVGALASTNRLADPTLLPLIDRAIAALDLIVIVWLWAFPSPSRLGDSASILLALLAGTLFALSLAAASAQFQDTSLNVTWLNLSWSGLNLLVAFSGIVFLLFRRTPGWGSGLGMLLLLFTGNLAQLLYPDLSSSMAAPVRLAQLAAYPILLALPQRLPIFSVSSEPTVALTPLPRLNLLSWLELGRINDPAQRFGTLARLLPGIFPAPAAAVLLPHDDKSGFLYSYDQRSDAQQTALPITEGQIPILWNALTRLRPLRLPASSSSADLDNLTSALGIDSANLMALPVISPGKELVAGLLLFNFQPGLTWSGMDQEEGLNFARSLARILLPNSTTAVSVGITNAGDTTGVENTMESEAAEPALSPEQEELRTRIAALQAENESLKGWLSAQPSAESSAQVDMLEDQLRLTLIELALLQKQLSEADQKFLEVNKSASQGENAEVITSIVQDLRQPMSSISGYTDLLLGESVGILGALQRKFLDRIKAATERMGALIEDLVQVSSREKNPVDLDPRPVDLNQVIDEAISHTSARMIEKNIRLHVDLPENLPKIQADQDALQQVVIHLLQNAGTASPADGEIVLSVQNATEDHEEHGYILLRVTDTGGGIPPEDLPRVFSRLYRADNPLIQGVGDTGVGLSVARSLVEALNGRIWVDSDPGKGSTFSVLLPVSANGNGPREDWTFS